MYSGGDRIEMMVTVPASDTDNVCLGSLDLALCMSVFFSVLYERSFFIACLHSGDSACQYLNEENRYSILSL